ncbi:MAG: methyltransferase domain-containing protein [Actinomycetota bacterium]
MAKAADFDSNPDYLRDVQYRDSTEIAKRAHLHARYRTAPQEAFEWFIERVPWPSGGRVLDVGCGAGSLWGTASAVMPEAIDLIVSDLSPGMVDEAVERATSTGRFASVEGRVVDAQSLPFDDASFDLVVSTYALYHVPEPARAVAEIARVVRPGGAVALMTNGPGHLREVESVRTAVFGDDARYAVNGRFAPAVATGMLVDCFGRVSWERFHDTLHVTDVDDLLAFVTSTPPATEAAPDQLAALRAVVEERMIDGVFVVSKHTGALFCSDPQRS